MSTVDVHTGAAPSVRTKRAETLEAAQAVELHPPRRDGTSTTASSGALGTPTNERLTIDLTVGIKGLEVKKESSLTGCGVAVWLSVKERLKSIDFVDVAVPEHVVEGSQVLVKDRDNV